MKTDNREMLRMAENLGYVEACRTETRIHRGDLVPYDDNASPLERDQINGLKAAGHAPGAIYPKRSNGGTSK